MCISSDYSKPKTAMGEEYKANMSFPLCASRKHHTCSLLMASIEKKKASERESVRVRERACVFERDRETEREKREDRERERARMCRTDCSSFPFLSPHAHSPRRSCDLVAPSVGPSLQRVSTEHAQSAQTVTPLHFLKPEDLTATEDIHWKGLTIQILHTQ